MRLSATLLGFNRGLVSPRGLARVDVKRIASLSAEEMTNFLPTVLGNMSIRPGWKYLGAMKGNNAAKLIPFVFAVDDTAIIELTTGALRVWRNDELITRPTVGTGITNGGFGTDLTGWTDADEAGATSSWATGGYMELLGDGTNSAVRYQQVTVSGGDANVQHALDIVIAKGPVTIRIGSTVGSDDYFAQTDLKTGTHSIAFTPGAGFYLQFEAKLTRPVWVDSVSVAASGVMSVSAPWVTADLDHVRWDQSGDIVFVACAGKQQRAIERRSNNSWSVVLYEPEDGPFQIENTSTITLTPSAIAGSITLTASKATFRSTSVGALYSLTSEGQLVTANISAQDTWTNAIRITGVDSSRVFTIILSGTWSATVRLQRSLESEDGPWETVTTVSWTANTTETFDDGLDNQIAWYRIGILTGGYTSGTVVATLDYALGAITGVVRVTGYTSPTVVSADVLSDLGGTDATEIWAEGAWSDRRGFPTAVAIHEGRLWWAGKGRVWGSVTDAYDSFDPDTEGDAGPISRSLGTGPVDRINWLFSSTRLLMGGDLNEYTARSSSLDEPMTPSAFSIKATSSQGSAAVVPGRVDAKVVFANRTGMKVFENGPGQAAEYQVSDLCQLVPEIGSPGIDRLAVQRQPDTRIHAIRSDGTVGLAVVDRAEEVLGWCEIETDGEVEDAVVLPAQNGVTDDYVYYVVKRDIDGSDVRYLEKWAQAQQTVGGTGEGGAIYGAYSSFDVEQTDNNNNNENPILYSAALSAFYLPGETTDNIWKHPEVGFPAGVTQIDPGADPIRATVTFSGCLSQDGLKYWLSGDSSYPVRCTDLTTGTTTAFDLNDYIVLAARDQYVILYSGGNVTAHVPNFSTGQMGAAVQTWSFDPLNNVSPRMVWDDDGWAWTVQRGTNAGNAFFPYRMIRINPTVSGVYSTDFPTVETTRWSYNSQTVYESTRDAFLVHASDGFGVVLPGLWRLSGVQQSVNGSGTWERVSTDAATTFILKALWYDPGQDVIFGQSNSSWFAADPGVYRYRGSDGAIIDFVSIAFGATINYSLYNGWHIYYRDNYGWVTGTSGVDTYLIRINYNGPDIVEGPFGENLLPGGSTGRLNNLADSYINYEGTPTTTITGLDHLEGETVVVWANGIDLGTDSSYEQTYTVSGGQITLPEATTFVTVGLPYRARFESAKLGLQTQNEVLFGQEKRITEIALILNNTHTRGLRYGPDFDNLDERPRKDDWADVDDDTIDVDYDKDTIQFPSTWDADTRLCLQAQAPRPCTVLAVQVTMEA